MKKAIFFYICIASFTFATGTEEVSVTRTPKLTNPIIAESIDLKNTIVTADFDQDIERDKNYIFSCSPHLAWNELVRLNGVTQVEVDQPNALIEMLNRKEFTKEIILEESYFADAIAISPDSIESMNSRMQEKFKDPPTIEVKQQSKGPGILAFAYFEKELSFATPFEASLEIRFNNQIIPAFGYDGASKAEKYKSQFTVDYYSSSPREYVISLITKSPADEVILGFTEPRQSLRETCNKILNMKSMNASTGKPSIVEKLAIPKMSFIITRYWAELLGKTLMNGVNKGIKILQAETSTCFRLNEKGAGVEAFSYVYGAKSIPTEIVFDAPFMIILKEKEKQLPYFVVWINNTEILLK
jgi:hypothetical protein